MTQMGQMTADYIFEKETEGIIKAFYDVYNTLGYGFLERVYQNALYIELMSKGYKCEANKSIKVYYRNQLVGDYVADILVNDSVLLELKAIDSLCHDNELQLINYLKSTKVEIGLLLNFGERPQIRRKIFTNDKKKNLCSSV